jgi:hypothetical protein
VETLDGEIRLLIVPSTREINVCEIDVVTCVSLLNDLSLMMMWWKDPGGTSSFLKAVDVTD